MSAPDDVRENVEFDGTQGRQFVVTRGGRRGNSNTGAAAQPGTADDEEESGILKWIIAVLSVALIVAYVFGVVLRAVQCALFVVRPAWLTVGAVSAGDATTNTKWLMYWLLFGCCMLMDILFVRSSPYHGLVIVCETVVLFLLSQNEARNSYVVFHNYVIPLLTQHRQIFDVFTGGPSSVLDTSARGLVRASDALMRSAVIWTDGAARALRDALTRPRRR